MICQSCRARCGGRFTFSPSQRNGRGRFSTPSLPIGGQEQQHRQDVAVVLVEPQIPQNAGNVARTCAASRTALSLVGPVGFDLDSAKLKRAGLDYWPYVCVNVHKDWGNFLKHYDEKPPPKRLVAFTKFSSLNYALDGTYREGDMLLFGAETHGLPDGAAEDIKDREGVLVKIPMDETHVRSLNLATSVGIGLFEAIRQLNPPNSGELVASQVDQPRADQGQ